MKYLFFIAALSMIVLLFSCKKETSQSSAKKLPVDGPLISGNNAEGLVNTYDSAGIWHNKALDYIRAKMIASGDTSTEAITAYTITFMKDSLHTDVTATLPGAFAAAIRDRSNNYENVIAVTKLSSKAKLLLDELIRTVNDTTGTVGYTTVNERIMQFEHTVYADPLLSQTDRAAILTASSVGRHSAWYWLSDQSNGGIKVQSIGLTAMFWKSLVKRLAVVTGDIGGAISGSISGAAASSAWWGMLVDYSMP